MASYFLYLFYILITKANNSVSKTTLKKELSQDTEVHQLGENNFMFGFSVDFNGINLLQNPSYLTFVLEEVRQYYVDNNNTKTYNREYISLQTELCKDSFVGINQTFIKTVGIDQYYCPVARNFSIAASYYASRYDYIQLKVFRCINSTSSSVVCKSTKEIDDAAKVSTLRFPITNTYFDFNNYNEPISHFIDDGFYWDLFPGFRKKTDLLVQK